MFLGIVVFDKYNGKNKCKLEFMFMISNQQSKQILIRRPMIVGFDSNATGFLFSFAVFGTMFRGDGVAFGVSDN